MEYQVKVWKQLLLTWQKKILIIEDDQLILKKMKSKSGEDNKIYPLKNVVVVDQSKINDPIILIASSTYKLFLKFKNKEEKDKIILKLEEIRKKYSSQSAFSEEYKINNSELMKD